MLARLCALVFTMMLAWPAVAAQMVRVGGYDFPPFVETDAGGKHFGLTLDLIAALNAAQSRYEFTFVPVSARRRYGDLQEGRFDAMFFESPEWGWAGKTYPVEFSNVFLRGGEIFIAQAQPGRGQDFFADIKSKRIIGILGYHYGFANFEADPEILAKSFNIKLVNSNRSSIEMVLAGRTDVAVVTDSYLWSYLKQNAGAAERLLVSDRYDQIYNHRILVRRDGPIDTAAVNALLADLDKAGTLAKLWTNAGVTR